MAVWRGLTPELPSIINTPADSLHGFLVFVSVNQLPDPVKSASILCLSEHEPTYTDERHAVASFLSFLPSLTGFVVFAPWF